LRAEKIRTERAVRPGSRAAAFSSGSRGDCAQRPPDSGAGEHKNREDNSGAISARTKSGAPGVMAKMEAINAASEPGAADAAAESESAGAAEKQGRRSGRRLPGILTIEAAFELPLFFMVITALACLFRVCVFQLRFQQALDHAVGNAAAGYYAAAEVQKGRVDGESTSSLPGIARSVLTAGVTDAYLRMAIVSDLGEEAFDSGFVQGGSSGITFLQSRFPDENGMLDVIVTYRVKIPLVPGTPILCSQRCRKQAWTGNLSGAPLQQDEPQDDSTIVYLTDHGEVYHLFSDCPYLAPEILTVDIAQIQDVRNESGGKYYPCPACGSMAGIVVYCTRYGTDYHGSPDCSFISHNIREVPLSEVSGMRCCSKCSRRQGSGGQ
jgi:hypothetical protein